MRVAVVTGEKQRTIAHRVSCAGTGVHSGVPARLTLRPAPAGSGIVFLRTDVMPGTGRIQAVATNVSDTRLGTTLSNDHQVCVAVVEHLLAAIAGASIDNLLIEIDAAEVPIMDGSSALFHELLVQAGHKVQAAPRRRIRILERIDVSEGPKRASLAPTDDDALTLRARIEYADKVIGVQQMAFRLGPGQFAADLAFARTFGFSRDVEMLQSMGLARGGSLENAVVIGDEGIMNPEGLRVGDEFIRHKLLDALGDLTLAGAPIAGLYEAVQPGHSINNRLVRALLDTPAAWCWEETAPCPAAAVSLQAAI
jgi:UDP-3-O-[3-hydroxymyristoyl] N-acetylglucosamine deacetylase